MPGAGSRERERELIGGKTELRAKRRVTGKRGEATEGSEGHEMERTVSCVLLNSEESAAQIFLQGTRRDRL